MNRQQIGVIFGILAVVVLGVIVLLVTGGGDPGTPGTSERPGDVREVEGAAAPSEIALADIEFAEVRQEGDELVFEARLGAEIPKKIKKGSFDLRWDIAEGTNGVYILSGNLDVGPNASLVGLENDFGSSTLDDSLPGSMEIKGNTWIIRLKTGEIPDFPEEIQWKLSTTLDGKAGDPQSGVAEDTAPDTGFGQVLTG